MELQEIKDYCLIKAGTAETYPFGPEPIVFKVLSKIFVLLSVKNNKISLSLKCDPFLAQNLRMQYLAVKPGYHLNKEHWNTVTIDGTIPESEIYWMIDHSYEMVVRSLSKAEKISLSV